MARINIEDSLFTDRRFTDLIVKVGSQETALGIVCGAWILAQKHWLKHRCIPKKAWPKSFDPLVEVELTTKREDGNYYVKGSKKAFLWLDQKVTAGRLGGQAPRKTKKKEAGAKRVLNESERVQTGANPLTLSLTLTPTLSLNSDSNSNSVSNNTSANDKNLNREIWDAYRQSYQSRYGVEPVRNASVNAKISQIAKRLGPDAIEVVKFFLVHNEGFYVKKVHDIGLCLADCESLRTQWKTGTQVTSTKVRSFERVVSQSDLQSQIKKGGF